MAIMLLKVPEIKQFPQIAARVHYCLHFTPAQKRRMILLETWQNEHRAQFLPALKELTYQNLIEICGDLFEMSSVLPVPEWLTGAPLGINLLCSDEWMLFWEEGGDLQFTYQCMDEDGECYEIHHTAIDRLPLRLLSDMLNDARECKSQFGRGMPFDYLEQDDSDYYIILG